MGNAARCKGCNHRNRFDFYKTGVLPFNIRGNKYRLVVWINYEFFTIYVRFVGTHEQYDRNRRANYIGIRIMSIHRLKTKADYRVWHLNCH